MMMMSSRKSLMVEMMILLLLREVPVSLFFYKIYKWTSSPNLFEREEYNQEEKETRNK